MGEGTMKVKYLLLGCALAALSVNAIAAEDKTGRGYIGVGYSPLTFSVDDAPDWDLAALAVRGGYYFNKYFSVEGRLGFGVGDDSQNVGPGEDIKVEIDYMLGLYAVGHIPLSNQFQLYGLVGYTKGELTATNSLTGESSSDDDSDLSYGVGAEFDMTNNWSLGLEYTAYFDGASFEDVKYDVNGFAVFVNYIF